MGMTSVGSSRKVMPQSAKRRATSGSKIMSPLSTGASGIRSRIIFTLYVKPVVPQR